MRIVVLALILISFPVHAERVIVIGDSLSSTGTSWPAFLRWMRPDLNIQVNAQPGRQLMSYTPPADMHTMQGEVERVIFFLGANDIILGQYVANGSPQLFMQRLKEQLNNLTKFRGFHVLLVVPPEFGIVQYSVSNKKYRNAMLALKMPNVSILDINEVWDQSMTVGDRIHPVDELSLDMAVRINEALGGME